MLLHSLRCARVGSEEAPLPKGHGQNQHRNFKTGLARHQTSHKEKEHIPVEKENYPGCQNLLIGGLNLAGLDCFLQTKPAKQLQNHRSKMEIEEKRNIGI